MCIRDRFMSLQNWSYRANEFGQKFTNSFLSKQENLKQNLLFSSLSIYICMGMLSEGMRDEAAKQMNDYFKFNSKFDQGLEAEAIAAINNIFSLKQLKIASGIFTSQRCPANTKFTTSLNRKYSGESFGVDFGSQEGISKINNWVSQVTNGRIRSVIEQPNPDIILLLANAIYFKGNWKHGFKQENTFEMSFFNQEKKRLKAQFMTQTNNFRHRFVKQLTLLELQYEDSPVSMVIAMEEAGQPILNKEDQQIVMDFIQKVGVTGEDSEVSISVPKFRFENSHNLENYFNEPLSKLFESAVNPKIYDKAETGVSKIVHKTFVQVDEVGTEAAAVTSAEIVLESMSMSVNIDKAFHFYIVEHKNKVILFNGFVTKPEY
eukprot:TRINITY_DN421_c0_g1_i1.p1 TRINITY_DN421_c0_g1~~TRINITY_DN421_c0_g1_i1.p1  ORF type:complete len:376 (-),score=66.58 TRINITY_DN421_c0_g1_i1:186-1313(-)